MRESSTYQYILEEGQTEYAHKTIIRQGRRRFGEPTEEITAAVKAITDLDRLDRILDRVQEAADWQELLRTP